MRCEAIPPEVPTPSTILADMDDLERRRRAATAELERVVAERADLVRAAADGDPLAQARVGWLNVRQVELGTAIDGCAGLKDGLRACCSITGRNEDLRHIVPADILCILHVVRICSAL